MGLKSFVRCLLNCFAKNVLITHFNQRTKRSLSAQEKGILNWMQHNDLDSVAWICLCIQNDLLGSWFPLQFIRWMRNHLTNKDISVVFNANRKPNETHSTYKNIHEIWMQFPISICIPTNSRIEKFNKNHKAFFLLLCRCKQWWTGCIVNCWTGWDIRKLSKIRTNIFCEKRQREREKSKERGRKKAILNKNEKKKTEKTK